MIRYGSFGTAWFGGVGQGSVRYGKAGKERLNEVWWDEVWSGGVRFGKLWSGKAGLVWFDSVG